MNWSLTFCSALITLALMQAANAPAVPVAKEPDHHLFLENSSVRVFKVEVPPHAQTLLHQHDIDYVFVTLGDTEIENDVLGKDPVKLSLKDGDTRFAKGGFAHVARNLSDKPFRNITIEILSPPPAFTPSSSGTVSGDGLQITETWLGGNRVRNHHVMVPAGDSIPMHEHKVGHLLVALSDLDFREQRQGEKAPHEVHFKAGDVAWEPAGITHSITNIGKQPARLVSLEFEQPKAEEK